MSIASTLLTAAEFAELPDTGSPCELVRGRIFSLNMPYPRHGEICLNIGYFLRRYLEDNPIGRVVTESGILTERDPDTVRGPDVAYFSHERVPIGPLPRRGTLDVTPELVFEVRSFGDSWREIQAKAIEYLAANVKAICIVDEQTHSVTVIRPEDPPHVLRADDVFSLPDLLPGFEIAVSRLFE